jgi:hypothetical protein
MDLLSITGTPRATSVCTTVDDDNQEYSAYSITKRATLTAFWNSLAGPLAVINMIGQESRTPNRIGALCALCASAK